MVNAGSKERERLIALQALRAVAATMVVLAHAQGFIQLYAESHGQPFARFELLPLATGVDLFFVISGFVVVFASQSFFATTDGWREFMRRRLIRIVPLYWSVLTLRLLVLAVGAAAGAKAFPDLMAIVTSYLFIPYDAMGFGSEYPFPIVDLGWTLNYEMFFYVLFACVIALPRARAVALIAACLAGGVVFAGVSEPQSAALRFWLRPITWEFAVGALVALAFFRGVVLPRALRSVMLVGALLIWSVPVCWLTDTSGPGFYGWARLCLWGTGAVLIVAAAVLGPTSFRSPWSRALARLGDSSYALYLLHPFVFLIVKALLAKMSVPPFVLWPLVLGTTALAVAVAAAFHVHIEDPVTSWLRQMTANRSLVRRYAPINERRIAHLQRTVGSRTPIAAGNFDQTGHRHRNAARAGLNRRATDRPGHLDAA